MDAIKGTQMCRRFTNRLTWREIVALYRLSIPATPERNLPARYNICPTDTIDAVIERGGRRELVPMRWGLVPSWWKKKAKEAPATFNARAETVAEKPMFRDAFKRSRCLIPASGYYEWQSTPTGKQPYYYTARDGSPLTIAGLWDEWKDIETRQPLMSCTMLITNGIRGPLRSRKKWMDVSCALAGGVSSLMLGSRHNSRELDGRENPFRCPTCSRYYASSRTIS